MESTQHSELFVQQLTEHQNRIYGYVFSLLGDHTRAADVVQETNLVLWRKLNEYDAERPFLPWAFAIARFQVLAHLRDHRRDRLLLDEELVATLGAEVAEAATKMDEYREQLRPCLQTLTPTNRELVEHRYFRSQPIGKVAEKVDRSIGAVKVALLRIRRHLADCVEKGLQSEVLS